MKRIAVFIEGANHWHAQKKAGFPVDAERLLDYCAGFGEVVEALYYTGVSPDGNQQRYYDWLSHHGYTLVTKPVKTIRNPITGEITMKTDFDSDITLDMVTMLDRFDICALCSGDSDYQRVLQYLKSQGKEVRVISTRGVVSTELVHTTGRNYTDLADIRDQIERKLPETDPAA